MAKSLATPLVYHRVLRNLETQRPCVVAHECATTGPELGFINEGLQ